MNAQEIKVSAMKLVAYACKFCRRPGVARYEPDLPMRMDLWIAMLSCDRCADYHESRGKIEDKLWACVHPLIAARKHNANQLQDIEEATRGKLDAATKRYAELVTCYYRLANIWDREFTAMIMDHPEKLNTICKRYRGSVRQMAKEMNP